MGLFPAKIRLLSKISKLLSKIIIQNMKWEYSRQRPMTDLGLIKTDELSDCASSTRLLCFLFVYCLYSLYFFQSFIPFDIHMKMK